MTTIKREDYLYSMTGAMLIKEADKLGVKVACNKTRTALKEAKSAVIERIIKADTIVAEPVAEVESEAVDTVVEVETQPEEKPVKKVRKVKFSATDEVVKTFIDDLVTKVNEAGFELKTWDKIKNLYAVKKNGKTVLECYVGKKVYRVNVKADIVPEGIEYTTVKNYYLPATIKDVVYTDTLVFDIIESLA